jgi:hypothetical protein
MDIGVGRGVRKQIEYGGGSSSRKQRGRAALIACLRLCTSADGASPGQTSLLY